MDPYKDVKVYLAFLDYDAAVRQSQLLGLRKPSWWAHMPVTWGQWIWHTKKYHRFTHVEIIVPSYGICAGAKEKGVFCAENEDYLNKSYKSIGGWTFIYIPCEGYRQQSLEDMVNFLKAQDSKDYNRAGGALTLFHHPVSGNGNTWFCSELVAEALKILHVLPQEVPSEFMTAGLLFDTLITKDLAFPDDNPKSQAPPDLNDPLVKDAIMRRIRANQKRQQ